MMASAVFPAWVYLSPFAMNCCSCAAGSLLQAAAMTSMNAQAPANARRAGADDGKLLIFTSDSSRAKTSP